MEKKTRGEQQQSTHPLRGEQSSNEKNQAVAAHTAAEEDIAADPEYSAHSPNDDLDEGETARLGENTNDII